MHAEFYQLVMAAVYHADGLWGEATFDLYARGLPDDASYLVAAGVEEAVEGALSLGFTAGELDWLKQQAVFRRAGERWWEQLEGLRFQGDIYALPEGSLYFPDEPMIRVTAPLIQAVLLETRLIQCVSHGTAVATRAARLAQAAGGRALLDFGSRRLPGPEASVMAARAAAIGGCAATTCSLAGVRWGLRMMGTLSTTYLAAYENDRSGLEAFSLHFPDVHYLALPEGPAEQAVAELARLSERVRIVRVDSADLVNASREVRMALDAAGLQEVRILGSGSLDVPRLIRLDSDAAPVDMVAVGRSLAVGEGEAGISMAYRLAEIWRGVTPEPALRPGASSYPGLKQVVRLEDRDLICLEDEVFVLKMAGHEPRLVPWVQAGERVRAVEGVERCQERREDELQGLPWAVRRLRGPEGWPVEVSERLSALTLGG
jgi:nicotinate phosphoribosyltransferase